MPFDDEDLKRLKEDSESNKYNRRPSLETVKAILARLEAAERGVFSLETVIRWMCQEGRYDKLTAGDLVWLQGAQIALEVWRKAAGK